MEKIRVLIADDMKVIAENVKEIVLNSKNFDVIDIVENGEEELQKIEEKQPDLVITDNQMPKMNGIDVIKNVDEKIIDTKPIFILVTGDSNPELRNICNELNVKILHKPVTERELAYLLDEIEYRIDKRRKADIEYKEWQEKYHTEQVVDIIKYFKEKEIEIFKKLGIILENKIYTNYEYDVIEGQLLEYYVNKKDMSKEEIAEVKPLEDTGVKRRQYNKILKKYDKIAIDYGF